MEADPHIDAARVLELKVGHLRGEEDGTGGLEGGLEAVQAVYGVIPEGALKERRENAMLNRGRA
jgi:hypothetical protein